MKNDAVLSHRNDDRDEEKRQKEVVFLSEIIQDNFYYLWKSKRKESKMVLGVFC